MMRELPNALWTQKGNGDRIHMSLELDTFRAGRIMVPFKMIGTGRVGVRFASPQDAAVGPLLVAVSNGGPNADVRCDTWGVFQVATGASTNGAPVYLRNHGHVTVDPPGSGPGVVVGRVLDVGWAYIDIVGCRQLQIQVTHVEVPAHEPMPRSERGKLGAAARWKKAKAVAANGESNGGGV